MRRIAFLLVLTAAGLLAGGCGETKGRYAILPWGAWRLQLWEEPGSGTLYYRGAPDHTSYAHSAAARICPYTAAVDGRLLFVQGCDFVARSYASPDRIWTVIGIYRPRALAALAAGSRRAAPPWIRSLRRRVASWHVSPPWYGTDVNVSITATPRLVFWLGREVLGSRLASVNLDSNAYYLEYWNRRAPQIDVVEWPAGSQIGRHLWAIFRHYPAIRVGAVTAYGRHDLVARVGKSVIRIRVSAELDREERRALVAALAPVQ